jgi:chitin synthase
VSNQLATDAKLGLQKSANFRTTREAIMARFPRADLTTKKAFLNESIDKILSES